MNAWLDRILGLHQLSTSGEGVEMHFAHPMPAWAWVLCIAAGAVLAGWTYWRLLGGRAGRIALGILRTLLIVLVLFLVSGPELMRQNARIESDWVIVLIDRSASLTVKDSPAHGGGGSDARETREAALERALRTAGPTIATLMKNRNVLALGFDSGAYDLRLSPDGAIELGTPKGTRTLIGQALDQALRRVAGRPVAGIVLLSDGRSGDQPTRALLKQLDTRQIPIFPVALGSINPLPDYAVARVDAPGAAFVGDAVPVQVTIDRLGADPATPWGGGKVQLLDAATGAVLDEHPLQGEAGDAHAQVVLVAHGDAPGAITWTVRLVPDHEDLSAENNEAPVRVELADRAIRVVYFDGYPRWEYRYVKNLLIREKSVKSTAMLLAPDRRYIQEGTEAMAGVPRTSAEWNGIDVVMMGDIRPGLFSEDQIRQIRALVADRGAGLLWIGGPAATPGAWRNTPLADLLPFTLGQSSEGGSTGPETWENPVLMIPGPAANRYGVLRLGDTSSEPWPPMLSDAQLAWPLLRWAQRLDPASIKPTAEVLALAQPTSGSFPASPLILTMRYGAGRIVYVGTDETWRYRYGRGEVLQERLWLPLLRLLARESLSRAGKPAILQISPEHAQVEQPVQVSVRLVDQSLLEKRPESIVLRLTRAGQAGNGEEITLHAETPSDEGSLPSLFTSTWTPVDPGVYEAKPADALLSGMDLKARAEITLPDDELRKPQADHELLALLAKASGGQMLAPEQLSKLPELLPNRQLRLLGVPDIETLWDKPIVWVVLMLLLTLEWAGRRLIKLA